MNLEFSVTVPKLLNLEFSVTVPKLLKLLRNSSERWRDILVTGVGECRNSRHLL
jgi:hypothetical protein